MTDDSEHVPAGCVRIDVAVADDVPEHQRSRAVLASVSLMFADCLLCEVGEEEAAITKAASMLRRSFAYIRQVDAAEAEAGADKPRH